MLMKADGALSVGSGAAGAAGSEAELTSSPAAVNSSGGRHACPSLRAMLALTSAAGMQAGTHQQQQQQQACSQPVAVHTQLQQAGQGAWLAPLLYG